MKRHLLLIASLLLALQGAAQRAPVSLLDYGLATALTDTARFNLLRKAHLDAFDAGTTVSYHGMDTLRLAIPAGAEPIPIGQHNDFGNTVFVVRNNSADLFLFQLAPTMEPLSTKAHCAALCTAVDSGDFRAFPTLANGRWLLRVVDSTLWVGLRIGRRYGHYREELMRVDGGLSPDRPAMPYGSTTSRPYLLGRSIGADSTFLFANITLLRDSLSTFKTFLLNLESQYSATLSRITVVTPRSDMTDDRILRLYHCASLTLDSVTLLGSYSRTNHSGYGLLMDNCRNTRVLHLHARSPWGIFGTNNMHNTLLAYSDFDRFDIHCYGRDVTFRHCLQTDSYNQFSSVFGTIAFDSCTFYNFTPVLIESSYNAYPHFVLLMHDCHWHLTRQNHTLINAGHHDTLTPSRPELKAKCLPDIFIDGLSLSSPWLVRPRLIHYGGPVSPQPVGGISNAVILRLAGACRLLPPITLSDKRVALSHPVNLLVTNPAGKPLMTKTLTSF